MCVYRKGDEMNMPRYITIMVFSVFDVCFFHGHQMEKQISLKTNIAYVLQKRNNSCYWHVILIRGD